MDRDAFFAAATPIVESVETRAGAIKVRSLSEQERSAFEDWLLEGGAGNKTNPDRERVSRAKLICLAAVSDDETTPLFSGVADVERLSHAPADIVMALYAAAKRAAGYASNLGEQVKNSDADPAV